MDKDYIESKEEWKEHGNFTPLKPAFNECQSCGELVEEELNAVCLGDEKLMVCNKCFGNLEYKADMEYERQKEEQDENNS